MLFRIDNTEGYTTKQMDEINEEWTNLVFEQKLDRGSDECFHAEKAFTDEVARR